MIIEFLQNTYTKDRDKDRSHHIGPCCQHSDGPIEELVNPEADGGDDKEERQLN